MKRETRSKHCFHSCIVKEFSHFLTQQQIPLLLRWLQARKVLLQGKQRHFGQEGSRNVASTHRSLYFQQKRSHNLPLHFRSSPWNCLLLCVLRAASPSPGEHLVSSYLASYTSSYLAFIIFQLLGASSVNKALKSRWIKNLPAMQETRVQSLGWEHPLSSPYDNLLPYIRIECLNVLQLFCPALARVGSEGTQKWRVNTPKIQYIKLQARFPCSTTCKQAFCLRIRGNWSHQH